MADSALDRMKRAQMQAELPAPNTGSEPASLGFDLQPDGPALMLDLVLRGGNRVALPYPFLTAIRLEASGGLTLEYAGLLVRIAGRDLTILHNHLLSHAVRRIAVTEDGFDDGLDRTWIESIEVAARDDEAR